MCTVEQHWQGNKSHRTVTFWSSRWYAFIEQAIRQKEGIKIVDPYDENVKRELTTEKFTVLVFMYFIPLDL